MTPILIGAWASPAGTRPSITTRATTIVDVTRFSIEWQPPREISASRRQRVCRPDHTGGMNESVYAAKLRPPQGPRRNFRRPTRRALQALRGVRQAGEQPERTAGRDGPEGEAVRHQSDVRRADEAP